MININHLVKVSMVWISISYVICFLGVALFPSIRPQFMLYALHTNLDTGQNVMTLGTFISGLIIWNILTAIGVWLFAVLYNGMRK